MFLVFSIELSQKVNTIRENTLPLCGKNKTRQVTAKGIGSGLKPFLWLKGFGWIKV